MVIMVAMPTTLHFLCYILTSYIFYFSEKTKLDNMTFKWSPVKGFTFVNLILKAMGGGPYGNGLAQDQWDGILDAMLSYTDRRWTMDQLKRKVGWLNEKHEKFSKLLQDKSH
jgi:hypothetical protein